MSGSNEWSQKGFGTMTRNKLSAAAAAFMAASLAAFGTTAAFAANNGRVGGEDRVGTAIEVMKSFKGWSKTAIVVAKDSYADAMSAAPLAGALKAPVLLTDPGSIDSRVTAALKAGGFTKVTVIGGDKAVSATALQQLDQAGLGTARIAAEDRYMTSVMVAMATQKALGNAAGPIMVATGNNFADALAAGTAAARNQGVVILTKGGQIPPSVKDFLDKAASVSKIVAVGGPAVAAVQSAEVPATPILGSDRYETTSKLMDQFMGKPTGAVLVTGEKFADSMTVAALAGITGKTLLATPSNTLAPAVQSYLEEHKEDLSGKPLNVIGGEQAVAPEVAQVAQETSGASTAPAERWVNETVPPAPEAPKTVVAPETVHEIPAEIAQTVEEVKTPAPAVEPTPAPSATPSATPSPTYTYTPTRTTEPTPKPSLTKMELPKWLPSHSTAATVAAATAADPVIFANFKNADGLVPNSDVIFDLPQDVRFTGGTISGFDSPFNPHLSVKGSIITITRRAVPKTLPHTPLTCKATITTNTNQYVEFYFQFAKRNFNLQTIKIKNNIAHINFSKDWWTGANPTVAWHVIPILNDNHGELYFKTSTTTSTTNTKAIYEVKTTTTFGETDHFHLDALVTATAVEYKGTSTSTNFEGTLGLPVGKEFICHYSWVDVKPQLVSSNPEGYKTLPAVTRSEPKDYTLFGGSS